MDLTKETHKRKDEKTAAPVLKASLASGVVVKFQSNNSRRSRNKRGAIKKSRREFFEHDTRKGNALKMKWPGNGTVAPVLAADTGTAAIGSGAGGCNEKMNSKARRAAKFREMKVLQRIMLSKEVNMVQLLPNLTPSAIAASNCCHCNCASSGGATMRTTENSVAATGQQCVESSNGGFGGGGGGGSFVVTEKEVVKSCSVR